MTGCKRIVAVLKRTVYVKSNVININDNILRIENNIIVSGLVVSQTLGSISGTNDIHTVHLYGSTGLIEFESENYPTVTKVIVPRVITLPCRNLKINVGKCRVIKISSEQVLPFTDKEPLVLEIVTQLDSGLGTNHQS